MINNPTHLEVINSTNQRVMARVELYRGSTLIAMCQCEDSLASFSIEAAGENKFFGFGVGKKVTVNLIDINRTINVVAGDTIEIKYTAGTITLRPQPIFTIAADGIVRDEETNGLTLTGYDVIAQLANHTFSELELTAPYTYGDVITAIRAYIGFSIAYSAADGFTTYTFENGANFDGSETLRSVMDAVAEATQTIYYVAAAKTVRFSRLKADDTVDYPIGRDKYYSLKNHGDVTLSKVCHTTELGDNISSVSEVEGVTQYVRDNPFWETIAASEEGNVGSVIQAAADNVAGLTIGQFESEWNGNYLLQTGDKVTFETEDGALITTYLISDVFTYDGTMSETTSWIYSSQEDTEANPANLGDALNQTFAKVDKVNRTVDIVASETNANTTSIGVLQVTTDNISMSVSTVEKNTNEAINTINENFETLSKQVAIKMSEDDVIIAIEQELSNGVDKVTTTAGYTFDANGLTISKSDSEISTQITEDGMTVSRGGEEVLRADNTGVQAEDLHATTYLIIGNNSRFEDYGTNRTGCFWIGG